MTGTIHADTTTAPAGVAVIICCISYQKASASVMKAIKPEKEDDDEDNDAL